MPFSPSRYLVSINKCQYVWMIVVSYERINVFATLEMSLWFVECFYYWVDLLSCGACVQLLDVYTFVIISTEFVLVK